MLVKIKRARSHPDAGGFRITTSNGSVHGESSVQSRPGLDLLLDAASGLFFVVADGDVQIIPATSISQFTVDAESVPALKAWLTDRGKARAGKAA